MRFFPSTASALLAVGHVAAAATAKAVDSALATRAEKVAPKFFIISMVCTSMRRCHEPRTPTSRLLRTEADLTP